MNEGKERVAVMRFRMTSGAKRARILFAHYLRFGFPHATFRGIHRILLRQTFGDRLVDLANDIDGQTGLLGNGFHRGTTRLEQVGCSFGSTVISGHDQTGSFARRTATAMIAASMMLRLIRIGCFMIFFLLLVVFEIDLRAPEECETVCFTDFLRIVHITHELFLKRRYSASYPEPVFFFFCAGFCFGVGRPFLEESRSRRRLSASTTRLICLAQETTVFLSPTR